MSLEYPQLVTAIENQDVDLFSNFLDEEHSDVLSYYVNNMVCYDKLEDARLFIRVLKKSDKERVKELVTMFSNNSSGSASRDMLKLAIDSGGDVNYKRQFDEAPLVRQIGWGDEENVKLLLEYQPDPNVEGRRGETALFAVVDRWSNEDFGKFQLYFDELLKLEANINHHNLDKQSLLHRAVLNKNIKVIKYLLEREINVNTQDFEGNTPLMLALKANAASVANTFIDAEVDLTIENHERQNALTLCARSAGLKSVKTKLRKLGYHLENYEATSLVDTLKSAEDLHERMQGLVSLFKEQKINIDESVVQSLSSKEKLEKLLRQRLKFEVNLDDANALDLFEILFLLVPRLGFECPVEPFSTYQEDELVSAYTDIFHHINEVVTGPAVLRNITGQASDGVTRISFEYSGETAEYQYKHDTSWLDFSVLSDLSQFAKNHLPGRFLIDEEDELSIPIFYLPKKVHSILSMLNGNE